MVSRDCPYLLENIEISCLYLAKVLILYPYKGFYNISEYDLENCRSLERPIFNLVLARRRRKRKKKKKKKKEEEEEKKRN
jgi:hypothetical protein